MSHVERTPHHCVWTTVKNIMNTWFLLACLCFGVLYIVRLITYNIIPAYGSEVTIKANCEVQEMSTEKA